MRFRLTVRSTNKKTGPIPVSTTSEDTCPTSCPFRDGACYAKHGPLALVWKGTDKFGVDFDAFLEAVKALPKGQLWRHNQAGDLPGLGDALDVEALSQLVDANKGRKGFTYTHKPLTTEDEREAIRDANARGFTVNLSANNLAHADELADLKVGPVTVTLPMSCEATGYATPAGRWVVVCPAQRVEGMSCIRCKLCAEPKRTAIIGFVAHGSGRAKVRG